MPHALHASPMPGRHRARTARKIARDGLAALAAFGLLVSLIGWNNAPVPPPPAALTVPTDPAEMVLFGKFAAEGVASFNAALPLAHLDARQYLQPTDRTLAVGIMAGIFAAIIAFNLWFFRHLGRVYASSRSGGGRRG